MADAECPVCINSFKFESMRSLHCGHTYCSSCVEQVIRTRVLKCPECRHDFVPGDVRRLFITPSTSNGKAAGQATLSDSAEEDGFIKQATHIASRLKKMDANSSAQSLKFAVEIMEDVATIQSKRAQEILWKSVREFWMTLIPFFEEWQNVKDLPDQISAFKQQAMELDKRCAVLERTAEIQLEQREQYSKSLDAKDREIAELKMMLRDADEKSTEERERYRVLLARHSASETKYRAQVRQLKKDLKTRERESVTNKLPFEEESLIVEPGMPYDGTRSHRLDVYDDSEGRKLSPQESARTPKSDDHFSEDEIDSLSSFHSSTQPESQGRQSAKRSHRSKLFVVVVAPAPAIRLGLEFTTTTPTEAGGVGIAPPPIRFPRKAKGPAPVRTASAR
ncbi:hypothetical protein H4582DRAFT_2074416 [Lactarius indigo]|nr:hypothetical protein H4582DRAFT_2074416 [Lactarius indigo]